MFKIKISLLVVVIYTSLTLAAEYCDEEYAMSKTKYGDIRGTMMKSRKGKLFAAFRGIPYAKAPVGPLRFKPPDEPDKWKDIRNATEDAPICIQQNFLFKMNPPIEGSEDCLYINVYSPKSPCKKIGKLLPVLVFVHYGAFMSGSSRSDIIGPEYIMDQDVVLVTFNYRLGIMGFLSTYDDEAPGNWAFKDQVAALKWVKNNIQFFGGNNKRVTLAGTSAGAGSVHHLILSPSAKGLFQAAISMSGTALAPWAKPLPDVQLDIAKVTGATVQCTDLNDTKKLMDCLRNVSAHDLVKAADAFRLFYSEPLTPYFASIEKKSERNTEPFITEDPYITIMNGNFEKIPWIIGIAAEEGILRAAPYTRQEKRLKEINNDFDGSLKARLGFELSVEPSKIDSVWNQIKNFYFKGKSQIDTNDPNSIKGLIDLYSDRAFTYSTYHTLLLHKLMGHKHIYAYKFGYRGKYSYGDLFALTQNDVNYKWGASHCDELLYLFYSPGYFFGYQLPKTDMKISEILLHFISNFIQYRDPTPKRVWGDDQRWEEIPDNNTILRDEDLHFLDIAGSFDQNSYNLTMANDYYLNRMKFWRNLPTFENLAFNNTLR